MVEFLTYNADGLYAELKERAKEQGAYSEEAWRDLVEEVIQEHVDVGEIEDDDALIQLREALHAKFADFQSEIREA